MLTVSRIVILAKMVFGAQFFLFFSVAWQTPVLHAPPCGSSQYHWLWPFLNGQHPLFIRFQGHHFQMTFCFLGTIASGFSLCKWDLSDLQKSEFLIASRDGALYNWLWYYLASSQRRMGNWKGHVLGSRLGDPTPWSHTTENHPFHAGARLALPSTIAVTWSMQGLGRPKILP